MISQLEQPARSATTEIGRTVRERLQASPYAALRKLSCHFHFEQGVLSLRGRLSSYYEKQLIQEWVAGIEGINQVVNETVVVLRPR